VTTHPGDDEREPTAVHHPTPDELAVEIWEDESPAPEPEEETVDGDG
jgi:hypothetical protein